MATENGKGKRGMRNYDRPLAVLRFKTANGTYELRITKRAIWIQREAPTAANIWLSKRESLPAEKGSEQECTANELMAAHALHVYDDETGVWDLTYLQKLIDDYGQMIASATSAT